MKCLFCGVKSLVGGVCYLVFHYLRFWLGVATIVCGMMAYHEYHVQHPEAHVDQIFYKTLQLFILQSGIESQYDSHLLSLARMFAMLWFIAATFKVLGAVFRERFDQIRLLLLTRHTIVCGFGRIGERLVQDLRAESKRRWFRWSEYLRPSFVVIELGRVDPDLDELRRGNFLIIRGDATDAASLKKARVLKAQRLFVVTGSDEANVEIVFNCLNMLGPDQRKKRSARLGELDCCVQLSDPTVVDVFSSQTAELAKRLPINVRVFNPVNSVARDLVCHKLPRHRPRERDEVALYVLLGFGPAGQAMALQIAELAHFENRQRARLLLVEENCRPVASRFMAQFNAFTGEASIVPNWEQIDFDPAQDDWNSRVWRPQAANQVAVPGVEYVCNGLFTERPAHFADARFLQMLGRLVFAPHVKPVIICCSENDRENFEIGGILANYLNPRTEIDVPIYLWLPDQAAVFDVVTRLQEERAAEQATGGHCIFQPFGKCDEFASLEALFPQDIEPLAERFHTRYQANYCEGKKAGVCADWIDLAESFRRTNRAAAAHSFIKAEIAGPQPGGMPDEATVELLGEIEHNRWVAERLLTGWRYDPQRKDEKQQRTTIIPWRELPQEERVKDFAQVREVFETLQEKHLADQQKPGLLKRLFG